MIEASTEAIQRELAQAFAQFERYASQAAAAASSYSSSGFEVLQSTPPQAGRRRSRCNSFGGVEIDSATPVVATTHTPVLEYPAPSSSPSTPNAMDAPDAIVQ